MDLSILNDPESVNIVVQALSASLATMRKKNELLEAENKHLIQKDAAAEAQADFVSEDTSRLEKEKASLSRKNARLRSKNEGLSLENQRLNELVDTFEASNLELTEKNKGLEEESIRLAQEFEGLKAGANKLLKNQASHNKPTSTQEEEPTTKIKRKTLLDPPRALFQNQPSSELPTPLSTRVRPKTETMEVTTQLFDRPPKPARHTVPSKRPREDNESEKNSESEGESEHGTVSGTEDTQMRTALTKESFELATSNLQHQRFPPADAEKPLRFLASSRLRRLIEECHGAFTPVSITSPSRRLIFPPHAHGSHGLVLTGIRAKLLELSLDQRYEVVYHKYSIDGDPTTLYAGTYTVAMAVSISKHELGLLVNVKENPWCLPETWKHEGQYVGYLLQFVGFNKNIYDGLACRLERAPGTKTKRQKIADAPPKLICVGSAAKK